MGPWARPVKQGLHQVLGNQSTLMKNGLLEQDGNGRDARTWLCWNATTPVTLVRGVTCRECGITGYFEVQHKCYGKGEPGHEVRGESTSTPQPEIGYQAPIISEPLNEAVTDLRDKIMARMNTRQPRRQLQRLSEVPVKPMTSDIRFSSSKTSRSRLTKW